MYLALCSQIKDSSPATKIWQPERWELAFSTEWSGWITGGEGMGVWDLQDWKNKKNTTAVPPHFHSWCLVTMTFGVICTYINLINIWQVVSFQAFLLHCMERSPASPRPLVTQGQTSPKCLWPSRLVYLRCSSVPQDSHGSDIAFIPLSLTCR